MPRLPVATKLPFWKTLNQAGVWPPGPEQQVEPPRRLIIAAVPFASPTESCSAPGTNLTKFESVQALLVASVALTGLPTFVIATPLAERPLTKVFWPVHAFCVLSFATFGERRASLMTLAVAASLMAETMLVPEGVEPATPEAVVMIEPSGKMRPLPLPLILRLPAT